MFFTASRPDLGPALRLYFPGAGGTAGGGDDHSPACSTEIYLVTCGTIPSRPHLFSWRVLN
jgi:hypothetical protein